MKKTLQLSKKSPCFEIINTDDLEKCISFFRTVNWFGCSKNSNIDYKILNSTIRLKNAENT